MFASLVGDPSSFFSSCKDHLKMLSLSKVSDVDCSVSVNFFYSIVDSS